MNRQEVAVEMKQNQTMVSPLKDVLHFFLLLLSLHPPIPHAGLRQRLLIHLFDGGTGRTTSSSSSSREAPGHASGHTSGHASSSLV